MTGPGFHNECELDSTPQYIERFPRENTSSFFSGRYTRSMRHLVDIGAHAEKEVIQ